MPARHLQPSPRCLGRVARRMAALARRGVDRLTDHLTDRLAMGMWLAVVLALWLPAATMAQGTPRAAATLARAEAQAADPVRIKDLGKLQGWRENALIGYGIVTGLAGTGDSPGNRTTRQAMSNLLSQFNLTAGPEQMQSRNVAAVMVTASLPPFARTGDGLDITVSSVGDARSLVGGSLMLTPLKAANGRVYALAQGPLSVGGYRYDVHGNVVQKNHPTVGSVPAGAIVEVGLAEGDLAPMPQRLVFVLHTPDFTTASRAAAAINQALGESLASAVDASAVAVLLPEALRSHPVEFMARLEAIAIEPDRRARVVINERTGTVVAGGDVRISRVSISHGDLRLAIAGDVPGPTTLPGSRLPALMRPDAGAAARLDVEESTASAHLVAASTVADLVQSLARLKTHTRDVISILRAIKAAGALHAELIVQ